MGQVAERHPVEFEAAKAYEKDALEHGSPFTWTKGEPLANLENPERIRQIVRDYEERKVREERRRPVNPLRPELPPDLDDLYGCDEGNGACVVCHK